MVDQVHYLKVGMVDREPFPSLGIMILELIEIGQNLQQEDRINSIKVDQELQQEVGLFPQ